MKDILSLFALLVLTNGVYAQFFEFSDIPRWVEEVTDKHHTQIDKRDIVGGFYHALIDQQTNTETQEEYYRAKLNLVSESGTAVASEFAIVIDTMYQTLHFHYCYVYRDGKKSDRTKDLKFEFINNETQLSNGIYSGTVTAYESLEDIRKDDVIEYAYTIKGFNPIYNGKSYYSYNLEQINPIGLYHLRILKPKTVELKSKCLNCEDENLVWKSLKNYDVLEIMHTDIPSFEWEEMMPTWHIPYKYLILSPYENETEVADWARGVFELNPDNQSAMDSILNHIVHSNTPVEVQIDSLIYFVQNEIRYYGDESGIGAIQPFQPLQTLSQRFGDCKDKTLLLVSLLNEIGVDEANPALVNTMLNQNITLLLPGAPVFNHVIVHFIFEGKEYWVDPTHSFQGGSIHTRTPPDYGNAFLVKENGGLVAMNTTDTVSTTTVYENFYIDDFAGESTVKVKSVFTGSNADFMRQVREYYSTRELSKQLKSVYTTLFDVIDSKPISLTDDFENNEITLVEEYTIEGIFEDSYNDETPIHLLHYEPINMYNYVTTLSCESKINPVQIPFPSNYVQQTTFHLPQPMFVPKEDKSFVNTAFACNLNHSMLSFNNLQCNYSFKTLVKELPGREFNSVCRDMQAIIKELPIQLYYERED